MRGRAGVLAFMALLAFAAPAPAQDPVEQAPSSSVEQYRESVPTARGDRPTSRRERPRPSQLPADVRRSVERQGGGDAEALTAIASEPGLGAPPEPRGGTGGGTGGDRPGRARSSGTGPVEDRSAPAAVADAAFGGSGGLSLLVVGLVASSALVGGAALLRRRRAG